MIPDNISQTSSTEMTILLATGNSIGCTFSGHILGGHERLYNSSDIEIVTTQGRFDSMHGNNLCLWLIKTKHQHDTVN